MPNNSQVIIIDYTATNMDRLNIGLMAISSDISMKNDWKRIFAFE